jgi:uncharacterized membrane protein
MTDLDGAASSQCHVANSVNARDQVVGGSCGPNADGWLWEGGTLSDLNTLVAPSAMQLTEAHYINDRGEIAVTGVLPSGDQRVVLLVPSGEANREGLTSNMPVSSSGVSAPTMHGTPLSCLAVPRWQAHLTQACHRLTRGA